MSFFSNLVSRIERRNRDQKDRVALYRMTDRELADIGISRTEIDTVFKKGRK